MTKTIRDWKVSLLELVSEEVEYFITGERVRNCACCGRKFKPKNRYHFLCRDMCRKIWYRGWFNPKRGDQVLRKTSLWAVLVSILSYCGCEARGDATIHGYVPPYDRPVCDTTSISNLQIKQLPATEPVNLKLIFDQSWRTRTYFFSVARLDSFHLRITDLPAGWWLTKVYTSDSLGNQCSDYSTLGTISKDPR